MKKNKLNIPIKIIIGIVLIASLGLYFNSVLKNWDIEQNLGSNYILCADGEIIISRSMRSLPNMSYLLVQQDTVLMIVGL